MFLIQAQNANLKRGKCVKSKRGSGKCNEIKSTSLTKKQWRSSRGEKALKWYLWLFYLLLLKILTV